MIKIIDSEFSHAVTVGNGGLDFKPDFFDWYRGIDYCDITVYTDRHINANLVNSKYNIAWLIEPMSMNPWIYSYIRNNFKKFDFIITHNYDLSLVDKRFILVPLAGCWINRNDHNIYEKSKDISIIASDKRMMYGHNLRHEIIKNFSNDIDLICGRGYSFIENKIHALKDYRYSIVVENEKRDVFFTEKIIDCFVTGTVPIYYGTDKIEDYFDMNGIIKFNSLDDLNNIFNIISKEDYIHRLPYIINNFELSKKWIVTENYIYDILFKKLLEM